MEVLYFIFTGLVVGIPICLYFLIVVHASRRLWKHRIGALGMIGLLLAFAILPIVLLCYLHQFVPDVANGAYVVWAICSMLIGLLGSFFSMRDETIICPNCHSWNKFTTKKVDVEHYVSTENIQRNVYNKRGDRIGYFDDTVDVNRVRYHGQFKCKKCGATFNQTY